MSKLGLLINVTLMFFLMLGTTWGSFSDEQFILDERAAIQRASAAWAQAINEHKPEQVTRLYANQISVYATFETQINTYKDLLNYFTNLSKKEDFAVKFNQENIRVYGPTAINSGVYTFSYTQDKKSVTVPARFTFVYALVPSGWEIVEHHSSVLPE